MLGVLVKNERLDMRFSYCVKRAILSDMNELHPLINKVKNYSLTHNLFTRNITIIIGLSGGPDSVFLLHFLHEIKDQYNLSLHAVHIDHEWRKESAQEALFCKKLCESLSIDFTSFTLSELVHMYDLSYKGSKEAYAREVRQKAFELLAKKYAPAVVALGHHADDQIETVFIRLIRGASLAGLSGMSPKKIMNNNSIVYVRPLLSCRKQEIIQYLDQHMYSFVRDSSNESDDFLRNRIRNRLIPVLNDIDSRSSENILKAIDRLQEVGQFLEQETACRWQNIVYKNNGVLTLDVSAFKNEPVIVQKRLLMDFMIRVGVSCEPTEKLLNEVLRFLNNNKSTCHVLGKNWKLHKKKSRAFIEIIV